jgi:hypothetical protein
MGIPFIMAASLLRTNRDSLGRRIGKNGKQVPEAAPEVGPFLKEAGPQFMRCQRGRKTVGVIHQYRNRSVWEELSDLIEDRFAASKILHPMMDKREMRFLFLSYHMPLSIAVPWSSWRRDPA